MKAILILAALLCATALAKQEPPQPRVDWRSAIAQEREPGDIINGFKEFCEGFWAGINELARWDVKMFTMCSTCFHDTWEDLKQFWVDFQKLMKDFNLHKLYVLCSNLLTRIFAHFAPCRVAVGFTLHFLDLFRHLTWKDVEKRLGFTALTNAYGVIEDVIGFIVCMASRKPGCAGEAAGELFYLLIFH